MAKQRVINTRFWIDDYIANLDPIEKLLFLYFLTNPSTDICGVYEIPLKTVATDTGIEKEMVEKILKRFRRDDKIIYKNGWVYIKNFIKHQSLNPKVEKGIQIGLERVPEEILNSLSYPIDRLSHLNSNSNLNSNINRYSASPREKSLVFFEGMKMLLNKEPAPEATIFLRNLQERTGIDKAILWQEVTKFINYWTEKNSTGTKERWQMEKTFEIERRLNNWLSKIKDFKKPYQPKKIMIPKK